MGEDVGDVVRRVLFVFRDRLRQGRVGLRLPPEIVVGLVRPKSPPRRPFFYLAALPRASLHQERHTEPVLYAIPRREPSRRFQTPIASSTRPAKR